MTINPPLCLAVVILVLAPWPLIRFVSIPSIRAAYSRLALAAAAILVAWCVLIVAMAVSAPWLLFATAAIAGCFLIAERWRARAVYGTKRGLPPGSLALVPRAPWVDEQFYAKQAARHGPIFKMSQFLRPMVCMMGPSEGVDLLERHNAELHSPPVRFNRFIPKGYIRYMAPADHAVYKPVLRTALSNKVLNDCSEDCRRLVASCLVQMIRASREERTGIHPERHLTELAFYCMLRLFLGLDEHSPDVPKLTALYRRVEIGKASSRWRSADREAANELADYVERRLRSREQLPSCVLSELARIQGPHASDRTVLLNIVYIIRVASSDLAGFLNWAVKILLDNPRWFDRLQSLTRDGREEQAAELALLMLREMLRLERSEYIFRKARVEFEYKGYRIPRNWIVRVCIRDGHRDAGTFPDPGTFDPMRFKEKSYGKREYSPLGIGAHACLGGQTVNVVGSIFLLELARRCRASVLSGGGREYGRSHWQPVSTWRIALMPLEDAGNGRVADPPATPSAKSSANPL